jgi:hypothetical protein
MKKAAPLLQAVGQRAHEGLRLRMDLGQVVVLAGRFRPAAAGRSAIGPGEAVGSCSSAAHHAALEPHPALAHQQFHRHRIEHLVADHHAADRSGNSLTHSTRSAPWRQRLLLPLAQAARQFDDGVAHVDAADLAERVQQLHRQRAGAGAELPDGRGARGFSSASATCTASVAPNSGVISGAVTKSLPDAACAPNLRDVLA